MNDLPEMKPIVHPVPTSEDYPMTIDKLRLFKRIGREAFEDLAGFQPPPFDESRMQKFWWHTGLVADDESYSFFNLQTGVIETQAITRVIASTPNIPGLYRYPEWNPSTEATGVSEGLRYLLTTRQDADILSHELTVVWQATINKGGVVTVERNQFLEDQVTWDGEERRIHELIFPTAKRSVLNAGLALRRKYQRGVGHPGFWRISAPPPIAQWIIGRPPDGAGIAEMDIPIRPLLNGEFLMPAGPWKWVVDHRDRKGGSEATGGFTVEDRSKLNALYSLFVKDND